MNIQLDKIIAIYPELPAEIKAGNEIIVEFEGQTIGIINKAPHPSDNETSNRLLFTQNIRDFHKTFTPNPPITLNEILDWRDDE